EEALAPGFRRLVVALVGELVLLAPADTPFLRHQLAVLAHRAPGARLGNRRHRGLEIARAQAQPGLEPLARAPAARASQHDVLQPSAVADRHIAHRVDAARDSAVDLPRRDAVSELHER